MKTAKFQYKCRLCGEVYGDIFTSEENAQIVLISIILEQPMPKKLIGLPPRMIDIHSGCKVGLGVADLIGYIIEGE